MRGCLRHERVHDDAARHLVRRADLERPKHGGASGHLRRRVERQLPGLRVGREQRVQDDLVRVHLHSDPDHRRRPRRDPPRRRRGPSHRRVVVGHRGHHLAVPERRVVRVAQRDLDG